MNWLKLVWFWIKIACHGFRTMFNSAPLTKEDVKRAERIIKKFNITCSFCEKEIGESKYIKKGDIIVCNDCVYSFYIAAGLEQYGKEIPWQVVFLPINHFWQNATIKL